jgi:DNA-directed RNA polymerase subunit RPC12/RpoP
MLLPTMAEMICLNCGSEMEMVEKSTVTGRDMREYRCTKCGKSEIVDRGIALWQAISDADRDNSK